MIFQSLKRVYILYFCSMIVYLPKNFNISLSLKLKPLYIIEMKLFCCCRYIFIFFLTQTYQFICTRTSHTHFVCRYKIKLIILYKTLFFPTKKTKNKNINKKSCTFFCSVLQCQLCNFYVLFYLSNFVFIELI